MISEHDVSCDLKAQLWADAERQLIEVALVDWPVAISQYRRVARLHLPRQDACSAARVRYLDEVMTFRPARSLAAHRPLGSVMRARLQVCGALCAFRHREDGIAEENTASIDRIPA